MKMKSVIALVVVGTLGVVGMAVANPQQKHHKPMGPQAPARMRHWNGDNLPPAPPEGFRPQCGRKRSIPGPFQEGCGFCGPRGGRRHGMFSPDMPQEIRDKAVEAAKLRVDLEDVLSQKPLNKAKAIEIYGQIGKLKQDIRAWRFEQKLSRIEKRLNCPERPDREGKRSAQADQGKPSDAMATKTESTE